MVASPHALPRVARARAARPQEAWRYRMYGLDVLSDIRLPIVPIDGEPATGRYDLVIRRMPASEQFPVPDEPMVAGIECLVHQTVNIVRHVGPSGEWLVNRGVTLHITPAATRLDVYVRPQTDEREVALLVMGQAPIFVLRALGRPVLHASAVTIAGSTFAFLGTQGAGKSSVAAGFLGRGAALVTDDALPLEIRGGEVWAYPSLGVMKLWPQTADGALALGDDELPELVPGVGKRLLTLDGRYALVSCPSPLAALYVLERYQPAPGEHPAVTFRDLTGQQAVATLIAQISWLELLQPVEVAASLPVYLRLARALPMRVVRYPSGFEHQDAVQTAILRDVTAQ